MLGVRNVGSFALEREVPVSDLVEPEGYALHTFRSMRCRDPTGTDVVAFASKGARRQATGRIIELDSSGQRTLWEGKAVSGVVSDDGLRAFVIDGDRRLSEIDLTSGRARLIRVVREEPDDDLHLSPDGRRLAWYATTNYPKGFLCVVEIGSGRQRTSEVEIGDVAWAADDRIVFGSGTAPHVDVRVFDANLEPMTSWGGWEPEGTLIAVGDRVYGYGNGRIQVASVTVGKPRIMRRFDGPIQHHLVAVPPRAAGEPYSQRGVPVLGIVAAALSLLALVGAAIARRR